MIHFKQETLHLYNVYFTNQTCGLGCFNRPFLDTVAFQADKDTVEFLQFDDKQAGSEVELSTSVVGRLKTQKKMPLSIR